METTELVTFEIATNFFPKFQAAFAVLVKKAAKLKVQTPTYEVLGERVVPAQVRVVPGVEDEFGRERPAEVLVPGYVVKIIKVSGQAPKLGGWSFVAVLQHEEAGNIIRHVPGTEELKVSLDMRTAPPYCGHCKTVRRRNDTYVVAHDDGRQLQIGRNCLKDFTGHDSPEAIARWAELLAAFKESQEDDGSGGEGSGGAGENHAEILDFLVYVACAIRVTGEWLSRTKAREFSNRLATADVAWNIRFPSKSEIARGEPLPKPTEADAARAARALKVAEDFFEAEDAAGRQLEDYTHNLRITVECKSVSHRSSGLAASLIAFSERLIGQEMERRKAATSAHQGTVGQRETFQLSVIRIIDIDSQYGTTHLHILQDAAGNRFKWKASRECLDVGATYAVKGTVKAHEEYKEIKQTALSRCKVELVTAAEA